MSLGDLDVLIIENVGNLVCPAAYDLGEDIKVVVLSITEGEEKPLKYPKMFRDADVIIIHKIDLVPHLSIDINKLHNNLSNIIKRDAIVFEVSSKTGEGIPSFSDYLINERNKQKNQNWL